MVSEVLVLVGQVETKPKKGREEVGNAEEISYQTSSVVTGKR